MCIALLALDILHQADSFHRALLAPVRNREKQLFEGLADFYYAMIYHSFLHVRKSNPKHDMCKFSAQFTTIYEGIDFLNDAYTTIDHEMHKFGAIYGAARNRLLLTFEACDDQYREQTRHDDAIVRNAKAAQALEDATNSFTVMKSRSASTVDSFDGAINASNPAAESAMTTMNKKEEAEEDRQFEAAIVVLTKEKLEREAAMAKAAADAEEAAKAKATGISKAALADKSKHGGKAGSSSSIVQAMRKIKEHKGKNESGFSSFPTMRRIKKEDVPPHKSSTL